MAGLGTQLTFPHHLNGADYGVIVEGAIKALVCHQAGYPTVGVMGKSGRFKGEWLRYFPDGAPIYIALDPDAQENAERLGKGIAATGKRVFVANVPMKPDDLVLAGSPDDLQYYLKLGRRVH
jgi:DNA primase